MRRNQTNFRSDWARTRRWRLGFETLESRALLAFLPVGSVAAGDGPVSVAVADLNDDGRPDLVTANYRSDNVSVLLGNGAGGFTPAAGSPIGVGDDPECVVVADLNSDGRPDLVAANYEGRSLSVLLGNGAGGFAAVTVPVPQSPYCVAVADVNDDGRPDLVTANGSNSISVLLGNGAGGFIPAAGSPVGAGGFPASVVVADLNGDGRPDLATANSLGDNVGVQLGNGAGGFTPGPGYPVAAGDGPRSIAVADLNDDDHPDLVTANYFSHDISVLLGNGAGSFTPAAGSPVFVGDDPISVAVADLNGDGRLDLVTASFGIMRVDSHYLKVLLGNGAGGFILAAGSPITVGGGPRTVAIADLNDDGGPDLVTANKFSDNVSVLLNTEFNTALTIQPVSPDPRLNSVNTIDVLFEDAIDSTTFTRDDITLTRNGGANLITPTVTITKLSDVHYQIGGLSSLTDPLGRYELIVRGAGIDLSNGTPLSLQDSDTWVRADAPKVLDIIDVTPDPRGTAVSSIDVTFNKPIVLSTFDYHDITLTRDGGANLITSAVTVSVLSGAAYRIQNLDSLTATPGSYELTVSGSFTDSLNLSATSSATETWVNNRPPSLALGGSTTFLESGHPQLLAPGALVSDSDTTVLDGGALNVAITANAASGDRLRVRNQGSGAGQIGVTPDGVIRYEGNIIGQSSGGHAADPLVVTLNANATLPAVQALVRAVTFANVDAGPPTELRTVQFLLDDGSFGISAPRFKYVNVQRAGGLPQISMGGEPSYTENAAPLVISPYAGVADADSLDFDGGKLTVAIVQNATADDRLAVRNQGTAAGEIGLAGSDVTYGGVTIGTLSGGVGATALEVALNVSATPAAVQALVQNVTFAVLGDNPSTALRRLSWVLDDGDGGINSPVLKSVRVRAVNDGAVITADAGPVGYINNDPAGVLFASTATVTDPDSLNFNHGQLTVAVVRGAVAANRLEIGGAFTLSSDRVMLGGAVIGRLTGNGVGFSSLVIQLTSQATRSIVEQLVRSIRFRSVGAIAAFQRTIAVTVLDAAEGFGSTSLVQVAVQNA